MTTQLFSDIIGSTNGHVGGPRRKSGDPQVVELILTNPDLVWAYRWHIPRYGPRTFIIAFEAIFKAYYGFEVEYQQFGKPNELTYDFAEKQLRA